MMEVIVKPNLRTNRLGGVDVPSAEVLKQMHDSQLHPTRCWRKTHPHSGGKDPAASQR